MRLTEAGQRVQQQLRTFAFTEAQAQVAGEVVAGLYSSPLTDAVMQLDLARTFGRTIEVAPVIEHARSEHEHWLRGARSSVAGALRKTGLSEAQATRGADLAAAALDLSARQRIDTVQQQLHEASRSAALSASAFGRRSGTIVPPPPVRASGRSLTESCTLAVRPGVDQRHLVEAARLPATAGTSARFEARLLAADVQGSRGFYPTSTLQAAANTRVFGKGCQVFLDHPTAGEAYDRPQRSVRDLAGRLDSDAAMRPDGLYAEVLVFPQMADSIRAMASDIGLSIRANGTAEVDPTGRTVITAITEALSVDFVTRPGAGGRIVRAL